MSTNVISRKACSYWVLQGRWSISATPTSLLINTIGSMYFIFTKSSCYSVICSTDILVDCNYRRIFNLWKTWEWMLIGFLSHGHEFSQVITHSLDHNFHTISIMYTLLVDYFHTISLVAYYSVCDSFLNIMVWDINEQHRVMQVHNCSSSA